MSAKVETSTASTLDLLLRLAQDRWRGHFWSYALAFGLMAIIAGTTAASAWMMKNVINKIFVEHNTEAVIWVPLVIVAIFIPFSYFLDSVFYRNYKRRLARREQTDGRRGS